jgi:hypothetical protein
MEDDVKAETRCRSKESYRTHWIYKGWGKLSKAKRK